MQSYWLLILANYSCDCWNCWFCHWLYRVSSLVRPVWMHAWMAESLCERSSISWLPRSSMHFWAFVWFYSFNLAPKECNNTHIMQRVAVESRRIYWIVYLIWEGLHSIVRPPNKPDSMFRSISQKYIPRQFVPGIVPTDAHRLRATKVARRWSSVWWRQRNDNHLAKHQRSARGHRAIASRYAIDTRSSVSPWHEYAWHCVFLFGVWHNARNDRQQRPSGHRFFYGCVRGCDENGDVCHVADADRYQQCHSWENFEHRQLGTGDDATDVVHHYGCDRRILLPMDRDAADLFHNREKESI